MLDETPFTIGLFEEVVEWLYREDRLCRGRSPRSPESESVLAQMKAPLLCVAEASSSIAPAASHVAVLPPPCSQEKRWLWYFGDMGVGLQHVGMLVGRTAHLGIWPAIVEWLRQQ